MKKIIKVGIIGCGRVSNHYAFLINKKKIKFSKIVAVCDKNFGKAKTLSKKIGGQPFLNYKKMIESINIDLVIILTESGSHYKICKYVLQKNIHVLCEKPLTMLPSKSLKLYKISKSKKLMCGVIFQNRFNPAIKFLKNALEKKRFGKIIKVSISLTWCRYQNYYEDGWHGTWKNDGGVINQQAIHHIDILRWLFGPIIKINATTTKRLNKLQAEDTTVAIIKLFDGSIGTIEATTAARPKDLEAKITINGQYGNVIIGGIALNKIEHWEFIKKKNTDKNAKNKYSQKVPNGYGLGHIEYLNNAFINILNRKYQAPVDAYQSYLTTKLIHAIYKSDETGKWISVKNNFKSKRLGNLN